VLAGIFRFQKFYRKWAQGLPYGHLKAELYDYYYDQAHFTKEFKRMTGYSPLRFTREVSNEFGRRLSLKQDFPFLQYPHGRCRYARIPSADRGVSRAGPQRLCRNASFGEVRKRDQGTYNTRGISYRLGNSPTGGLR
jgi:hypothetical protein